MDAEPDNLYSYSLLLGCIPILALPSTGVVIGILLIVLLLACSALISSSEVAFFSLSSDDYHKLEQENSTVAQHILSLKNTPRHLLATILIANNFINIGIVVLSDFLLRKILPIKNVTAWMSDIPADWLLFGINREALASYTHFGITVVGVTFLLVLFGEVAPKVYANINNMHIARTMAGTLVRLSTVFKPLSKLLVSGTNAIEKRLESRTQNNTLASKEDIDQAIELTVKDEQQDIDILKGIVKFGEVSVKQIMRSRVDVVAVDFTTTYPKLLKIVKDSGYSRLPVFTDDFDNIIGILFVKDLLPHLDKPSNFEWQALIRPEFHYVPEAKKINDLLKEFQTMRLHLAVVVDEYGGSSGIVTLEDIMEEVIGEIKDEFDDVREVEFKKLDDFNYQFEGKTLLNDACRVMGLETDTFDEEKGDADSLAGLVLEIIGFIPRKGRIIFSGKYRLEIIAVNKRRIEQIKITLPNETK